MFSGSSGIICGTVLVVSLISLPAAAQEKWEWPEKPENLQVLPSDWPGKRLRAPMRGFTSALGVSCAHCHVGKEGEPRSTYDFASDANPNKERAREMLRMLGSINEHLDKIEPSGDTRVNMWCHTCHRGRPRPTTLTEELTEAYSRDGVDGVLAHYAELKTRYYGQGTLDFGERALNQFGYGLLRNDSVLAAIRIFQLNAEMYPESGNVWDSLAEAYLASGDRASAIQFYRKSLELDPSNRNAEEMLDKLADEPGE